MTTFTGTSGVDTADVGGPSVTGFTTGVGTDLTDANDDTFDCQGGADDDGLGGTKVVLKATPLAKEQAHKVASDHDSDRDGFAFANLAGPRKAQDVDFLDNHDQGAFHLAAHSEAPHFGQVHFDWVEWTSHPRSDFFST
ncbi:MAG TPA: hypothetical protein VIG52_02700 [Methyloceanibacter sp.]|jgi:hypothetical protein